MRAVPKFSFDPVHRPCRCQSCCFRRLLNMLNDLDAEYGPQPESITAPKKDLVQ
jgi:hypothetical protein